MYVADGDDCCQCCHHYQQAEAEQHAGVDVLHYNSWHERQDLNPHPTVLEAVMLPLHHSRALTMPTAHH